MKSFLVLVLMLLGLYTLHNYRAWDEKRLKNWLLENSLYTVSTPQTACDSLAPEAIATINDKQQTRLIIYNNIDKDKTCNYFNDIFKIIKRDKFTTKAAIDSITITRDSFPFSKADVNVTYTITASRGKKGTFYIKVIDTMKIKNDFKDGYHITELNTNRRFK